MSKGTSRKGGARVASIGGVDRCQPGSRYGMELNYAHRFLSPLVFFFSGMLQERFFVV